MTVLHIYDPDEKLGSFELSNFFRVTRGEKVTVHIDRGETNVDIVNIDRDGIRGDIRCTYGIGGCGCP